MTNRLPNHIRSYRIVQLLLRHALLRMLLIVLLLCSPSIYAQSELFVPASSADLNPKQQKVMLDIQKLKTTASVQLVTINPKALDEANLKLTLSPTTQLSLNRSQLTKEDDFSTWVGAAEVTDENAVFVVNGQNVTGTIHAPDGMYKISPLGNGVHAVIKQDESKKPPEHPPDAPSGANPATAPGSTTQPESSIKTKAIDSALADASHSLTHAMPVISVTTQPANATPVLEILVAFTPECDDAVGGDVAMQGLADLAIKETNIIYVNSGIRLTAHLAKLYKVNYTESGSFQTDVDRLAGKHDGYMDDIHQVRDQSKADVVVLLVKNDQYCGLADAIKATEDTAFAAVHYGCATGYYSFAHEIGHLQGARHNAEADNTSTPYPYGHGMIYEPGKWRTVMAYDCSGGCTRLPYFSSPLLQYHGVPMGSPNLDDNARVLNETAGVVSEFRH